VENAKKTWRANTPRATEIEDALCAGREHDGMSFVRYIDGFLGSLAQAFDRFGKLTDAQSAAVLKGIDARAAKRAQWDAERAELNARRVHVGTVGEKLTLTLSVVRRIFVDTQYGSLSIFIMEDADRNVIVYKGNADCISWDGDNIREQNVPFTITATVKAHEVREGVPQTIIQRPKAPK
jgi:hypothetical protein